MITEATVYEFAGLRFSPFGSILENISSGKKIKLTQTHCHFLATIVIKSPEIVEYDELRRKVWMQYPEMTESLKHLMQETKSGFIKTLKNANFPSDLIGVLPKKGYRLNYSVKIVSQNTAAPENVFLEQSITFETRETTDSEYEDSLPETSKVQRFAAYKLVSAFFYGLLFSLALLLETAYKFDAYGVSASGIGVPLIILNGAALFIALTSAQRNTAKRSGFWFGAFTLIIAACFSCAAISLFLPFEPITAARFQAQPAFAAFLKNVFIYFLPLGVFYLYAPFFLLCRAPEKLKSLLRNLFGLLFLTVVYSLISTFYLLDRLEAGQFHGLFVVMTFLRFIVYFGLALSSLLWVKAQID